MLDLRLWVGGMVGLGICRVLREEEGWMEISMGVDKQDLGMLGDIGDMEMEKVMSYRCSTSRDGGVEDMRYMNLKKLP